MLAEIAEIAELLNLMAYNHGRSPRNGDESKEIPRTKLSKDDNCRWLEEDIRNKEDEHDDAVTISDESQILSHSRFWLAIDQNLRWLMAYPAMLAALKLVRSIRLAM